MSFSLILFHLYLFVTLEDMSTSVTVNCIGKFIKTYDLNTSASVSSIFL